MTHRAQGMSRAAADATILTSEYHQADFWVDCEKVVPL